MFYNGIKININDLLLHNDNLFKHKINEDNENIDNENVDKDVIEVKNYDNKNINNTNNFIQEFKLDFYKGDPKNILNNLSNNSDNSDNSDNSNNNVNKNHNIIAAKINIDALPK